MNLIIVHSHRRTVPLGKVSLYHLFNRFEVDAEYKVELLQALQRCLEVLQRLCEILVSKVYGLTMTTSKVPIYKKDFQLLQ